MAGDWLKVEKATARKPEVLRLSEILGVHPDHAFGLCVRFWSWCDDQMESGHALRVTNVTLDSVIGHAGFASALIEVGWLRVREGSLEVPNFDRHLSQSAKNRALSALRKRKERVTKMSRSQRDKNVTREEKRREELKTGNVASQHSCSEPASPPSEPPVMVFDCVKGEKWNLVASQVAAWSVAYPAVDILAECRKASAWIEANPVKRKTSGGMGRFLNGWLSRCQDRGGSPPSGRTAQTPSGPSDAYTSELERRRAAQRARLGVNDDGG